MGRSAAVFLLRPEPGLEANSQVAQNYSGGWMGRQAFIAWCGKTWETSEALAKFSLGTTQGSDFHAIKFEEVVSTSQLPHKLIL